MNDGCKFCGCDGCPGCSGHSWRACTCEREEEKLNEANSVLNKEAEYWIRDYDRRASKGW